MTRLLFYEMCDCNTWPPSILNDPWRTFKFGKHRYEQGRPIESQPWKPDISTLVRIGHF
jgi:hypothetical protein